MAGNAIGAAAFQVTAVFDCQGHGFGGRFYQQMVGKDIMDGAAVGDHKTIKTPFIPQNFLEQGGAGAAGFTVGAIIGAHDGIGLAFGDAGFEGRQVGHAQIALGNNGVENVALSFWSAVHGKMFGGGNGLQVSRVIALQSTDELHAQAGCQVGVFSIGFLTTPPAWVAKDIDIGRPEGQPGVLVSQTAAEGLVMLGAPFIGNGLGDAVHQFAVPGTGQANRLGEDRGDAGARHTV